MRITVKARVIQVKPHADGLYGITLGPGRNLFWFKTTRNNLPKIGQLCIIEGAEAKKILIKNNTVTILTGGIVKIAPDKYARRIVPIEWIRKTHDIMRRPLYPYQTEGAAWLASRLSVGKSSILGDDPGLGKTAQVLAAVTAANCLPVIIICPPSVKHNWAKEVNYLKPKLKINILNGRTGAINPAHVIIANYDIMQTREAQFAKLGAKCIIFDEAQVLKEPVPKTRTHRAMVATRLSHSIGKVIHLTGTPLLNRPQEMWRLLYMLDKEKWSSYVQFRKRYCTYPEKKENPGLMVMTNHSRAKHIDELKTLIDPYFLRRLKKDVLQEQLPPKERRVVKVKLEPFDQKNYNEVLKDIVEWLKRVVGKNKEKITNAIRGQAIVKFTMLRKIAAIGKLRVATERYIKTWFEKKHRPLVIFAYHTPVINGTIAICKKLGLRIASIRGNDDDKTRQNEVNKFQNGEADVFIASIKSAGAGINLQRARDMLCLERLWTPMLMEQAESRCHRIGQTHKVTITYLDAEGTIDEYVEKVCVAKQLVIDKIIDEPNKEVKRQVLVETIDEIINQMERGI